MIVGEPGGLYLTHFCVEDGKGVTVGKAIYKELENTNLQNSLSIVGSDGTAIMTGKYRGSNATVEQLLQRPLLRVIYFLHTNELPFWHIFMDLYGVSTSPDSFSGPIGKRLYTSGYDWQVVNFEPFSSLEFPQLPKEVIENLSSD